MDDEGEATDEARYDALGRHLRALRAQRRWSQEKLREKSGVSQATIRSIESNYPHTRRHARATLMALSRALDLPNDYLLNYLDNPLPEVPGNQPEPAETEQEQSAFDLIVQHLRRIEAKLDRLMAAHYPGTPDTRIDVSRSSEHEKE